MQEIVNDRQFRQVLNALPLEHQRRLGVRFANSVHIPRSGDSTLAKTLDSAMKSAGDSQEREFAYKSAKSIATNTYAACGTDADWLTQAEHFVAASCAAALTPEDTLSKGISPAWKAALQARMAQNCLSMETDTEVTDNEAQRQYLIALEFIAG